MSLVFVRHVCAVISYNNLIHFEQCVFSFTCVPLFWCICSNFKVILEFYILAIAIYLLCGKQKILCLHNLTLTQGSSKLQ